MSSGLVILYFCIFVFDIGVNCARLLGLLEISCFNYSHVRVVIKSCIDRNMLLAYFNLHEIGPVHKLNLYMSFVCDRHVYYMCRSEGLALSIVSLQPQAQVCAQTEVVSLI